jgi:hypothetical protein
MKKQPLLLYLSDRAYAGLYQLGIGRGYIKPNLKRIQGMSAFVEALSFCEFEDVRPDNVREEHVQQLLFHRYPAWRVHSMDGYRRMRTFMLRESTHTRFALLALQHKIIFPRLRLKGAPSSPLAITANVLEAIGIGYLQPLDLRKANVHAGLQQVADRERAANGSSEVSEEDKVSIAIG